LSGRQKDLELLRRLGGIPSVSKIENDKQKEKHLLAHSKAALIALAVVLSCSTVFAQGDPPGQPSDSPSAPDSMGPRGGMQRGGPGRDGGGWGRGNDGGNWGRGEGDGFGGGGKGMRGRGMGGRQFGLGRLLGDPAIREQLGVTADQAAKIRQQESDFRKTAIRNRADVEVKQIDLRDLMSADKPDRAAIDAKLQEISTARLAFQKSAIDYRLNSRDALTPAQRDKLRQIMRDRRGHRDGDGQRGAQRGGRDGQRGQHAPPPNPANPPPANQ
jgi:Spy/CpxP family protein refolding chaperone